MGVGSANQSAIEHYNGSTWSVVASPNAGTTDELTGVACAGAGDCWAVGLTRTDIDTGRPHRALHRVGVDARHRAGRRADRRHLRDRRRTAGQRVRWSQGFPAARRSSTTTEPRGRSRRVPTPISHDGYALGRVRCYGASNCWAVGEGSPVTSSSQALAEHYNGTAWSLVAVPDVAVNEDPVRRGVHKRGHVLGARLRLRVAVSGHVRRLGARRALQRIVVGSRRKPDGIEHERIRRSRMCNCQ